MRLEKNELKTYCVLLVIVSTLLIRFIGGF